MAERAYIVTKGVVLRETETKEADKILTLLTADRGKISVIARGVRRKSCKYAACAQQLAYSEWTLYQKGDWYYANEGATAGAVQRPADGPGGPGPGLLLRGADGGRHGRRRSPPGRCCPTC